MLIWSSIAFLAISLSGYFANYFANVPEEGEMVQIKIPFSPDIRYHRRYQQREIVVRMYVIHEDIRGLEARALRIRMARLLQIHLGSFHEFH